MYRDPRVAADAQIEALRADLWRMAADLEASERARTGALEELDRAREGVEHDPALDHDRAYVWAQRSLRVLGVLALAVMVVGLWPLLVYTIDEPLFSWQGVLNLAFHLRHGRGALGIAASGAALVLASPWLVLPWLGVIGLARHRRWGWFIAAMSCVLYTPTPLMPFAVYALSVLLSGRVRRVYFPKP